MKKDIFLLEETESASESLDMDWTFFLWPLKQPQMNITNLPLANSLWFFTGLMR